MKIDQDLCEEINLLACFDIHSLQTGIKVHADAGEARVKAANSLFEKGLVTQTDGGYLTDLGITAVEHIQHLIGIVSSKPA
jgi:uncharacterized protein (TIGR02647 family)